MSRRALPLTLLAALVFIPFASRGQQPSPQQPWLNTSLNVDRASISSSRA